MTIVHKTCAIEVISKSETGGRIRISTSGHDRAQDRVFPRGGRFENYLNNPIVQWGHNYNDPWATIGKTTVLEVFDDFIEAEFELRPAANEHDPQNIVILLWQGGWIKTASIGFNPDQAKGNSKGGRDFTGWELLEWSLVPIPMNQDALKLAIKGFEAQALAPVEAKELSLDKLVGAVFDAIYRALYTDDYWSSGERIEMRPVHVYPTYAIALIGLEHYRVEYVIEAGRVVLQEREDWTLVEQTWIAATADEEQQLSIAKQFITRALATDPRNVTRAGARHSKADQDAIQAMHDLALKLGATCDSEDAGDGEAKHDQPDEAAVIVTPTATEAASQDLNNLALAVRELKNARLKR